MGQIEMMRSERGVLKPHWNIWYSPTKTLPGISHIWQTALWCTLKHTGLSSEKIAFLTDATFYDASCRGLAEDPELRLAS